MNPNIETVFNQAESRYLDAKELSVVGDYVQSIPARLEIYRVLRDKEVDMLQAVADQLQKQFPNVEAKRIERSIRNAILALRACAMGMLLNDENYVQERTQWLQQNQRNNQLQDIDQVLYNLLEQQLTQTIGSSQVGLLKESFDRLKTALLDSNNTAQAPAASPAQAAIQEDELSLESLF